jgi:hypothetical protein
MKPMKPRNGLNSSPSKIPLAKFVTYVSGTKCYLCVRAGQRLAGAPGGTRTPGLLVRSQSLYPAELRAHCLIVSS